MLEFKEKYQDIVSYIDDCRQLNRAEMIGFISVDIMSDYHDDFLMHHFRKIYRGITKGPWTIQCHPTDNSVSYIIDDYEIIFYPMYTHMRVMYNKDGQNLYTSSWTIDEVMDILT